MGDYISLLLMFKNTHLFIKLDHKRAYQKTRIRKK